MKFRKNIKLLKKIKCSKYIPKCSRRFLKVPRPPQTLKNIKKWYVPKKKKTPFHLLGTSSKILYEPKGICLIISPWNYPLNLTLNPLVSSIAAGNFNFIKPSEFTPYTSELIDKMINLEIIKLNLDFAITKSYRIGFYFSNFFYQYFC